jgi:hypothetical protein
LFLVGDTNFLSEALGEVDDFLKVIEVLAIDGDIDTASLVFKGVFDLIGDLMIWRSDTWLIGGFTLRHKQEGLFVFGESGNLG